MRRHVKRKSGWTWALILTIAATLAFAELCHAGEPSRDARITAAFIYNFTQFVEWPADSLGTANTPFIVGVVGADTLDGALEQAMEGKTVDDHPIVVKRFASREQIGPCHLLFVPLTQDGASAAILARVARTPTLTVGEGGSFLPAGGALRLFLEDRRLKFELAPDVFAASRLKPGAKLMKLARIYKK